MKIAVCGFCGKMGRTLCGVLEEAGEEIAFGVDPRAFGETNMGNFTPAEGAVPKNRGKLAEEGGVPVYETYPSPLRGAADGVIDFSAPPAIRDTLFYATANQIPAVVASTALRADDLALLQLAGEKIPVFYAANFSRGVFALTEAVKRLSALLPSYDCALTEAHHRRKKDAPSGTAEALLSAMGDTGTEVATFSLRVGGVPGTHEVGFYGAHEEISIRHRAYDRALFAEGALAALRFLLGKPAGLYGMKDLFYAK